MGLTPLRWLDPPDGPAVELLDQTQLPATETVLRCADVPALVGAIRRLAVRGAPMLGIAAGYGVALAAARGDDVAAAAEMLTGARPTAVNLGRGAWRVAAAYQLALQAGDAAAIGTAPGAAASGSAAAAALAEARSIEAEDARACAAMAEHGLRLVPAGARILTHCNTGALVAAGSGTAFGLVHAAHQAGRLAMLWVDETRPLLQGSRLTAYEASRAGIPYRVLPDSAAASLMAAGQVDLVVVGADRIAADGSVANKVGSYGLAVLARHHAVPFIVVAPVSTIDLGIAAGGGITIEHRPAAEVTQLGGRPVAPPGTDAYNPAFDVTPPDLVTAVVTEHGIAQPVTQGNLRVLAAAPEVPAGHQAAQSMERWES